jgi:hypothetical protein
MIFTPILGIVLLVLAARAFGFARNPRLADAAEAAGIAAAALPGFRPGDAAIAVDGRAALVAGRDGAVALVSPMGDRWVVRLLDDTDARLDGGTLLVRPREWLFPRVRLDLGAAAPGWARRLGAALPAGIAAR